MHAERLRTTKAASRENALERPQLVGGLKPEAQHHTLCGVDADLNVRQPRLLWREDWAKEIGA